MTLPTLPTPTGTRYAHGKTAVLIIGGTFVAGVYTANTGLVLLSATLKLGSKGDKHDVTMSPNTGAHQYQIGLNDGPFSAEGLLDTSQLGPGTLLQKGQLIALAWYPTCTIAAGVPTVSGVPYWQSQYCVVDDVEYSSQTNDQIKITFSGNSGGDLAVS